MLGIIDEDLEVRLQKVSRVNNFKKLPKDINHLGESYRELVRELAKR